MTRKILMALGASLLVAGSVSATCVNPEGSNGCYSSIQAAVDAATAGEVIQIADGVYKETVLIPVSKEGITLRGTKRPMGPRDGATIDAGDADVFALTVAARGVRIEKLAIINGNNDGIHIGCDDGPCLDIPPGGTTGSLAVIKNVYVNGSGDDCIDVEADDVVLQDAEVFNCGDKAISWDGVNADISHVDLRGCTDECMDIDSSGARIRHNRVRNAHLDGSSSNPSDSSCIKVDGDDVVIEMNWMAGCGQHGIEFDGNGVIISKNRITGALGDGIFVEGEGILVEQNHISSVNDDGISLDPGVNAILRGNVVDSADDEGIIVFGDDVLVERNTVNGIGGRGIETDGFRNQIVGNRINATGVYGIAGGGADLLIADNEITGARSDGMNVDADRPVITGNSVSGSLFEGIEVDCLDCSGGELSDNIIDGTVADFAECVVVDTNGSAGFVVSGNTARNCGEDGMQLRGGMTVSGNHVTYAGSTTFAAGFNIFDGYFEVVGNVASFNYNDGININEGSGSIVSGNTAEANGSAGIDLDGFGAGAIDFLVSDNVLRHNAGAGLEINGISTGTTVSGNVGVGNGPDFCDEGAGTTAADNDFESVGPCELSD